MKRGIVGTYYKMSPKHLHWYAAEFAGRHNLREKDTLAQMGELFRVEQDRSRESAQP